LLPAGWVRWITASVFLGFGLLLLLKKETADPADSPAVPTSRVLWTTFLLVFAAEWGDATQVGTAALIARFREPLQVFIGATLGLWLGAALAVVVGRTLGSRLPARVLRRAAGVLFCLFAIVAAIKMD
jgi:putative Ca2+/H+ antiporter (TMEM165/GDT1 family)